MRIHLLLISALCMCGCSSLFRAPDTLPSEIILKALDSGTLTLLERTGVYSEKSGIRVVERVARDSDGKPVTIRIGSTIIPVYERECVIVHGQDLPQVLQTLDNGTPVPEQQGLSVIKQPPVRSTDGSLLHPVPGPVYPHPGAAPVPGVYPDAAPAQASVPIPKAATAPAPQVSDVETVTFATRESNTEWTFETEAGHKYRGTISNVILQHDNSIEFTVTLESGAKIQLQSSGLQAKLLQN